MYSKLKLEEDKNINVLNPGYIFTREGDVVVVPFDRNHCDIFTSFYNSINNVEDYKHFNSIDGAKALTELGNIIYFGTRLEDCYTNNTEGLGILIYPDNFEISTIQKEKIDLLLSTNISIFNGVRLDLKFVDFIGNEYRLDEYEKLSKINKIVDENIK